MKLSDPIKGQSGSVIAPYLNKSTILEIVEINGTN